MAKPAAVLAILVEANTGPANAALMKTEGQLHRTGKAGSKAGAMLKTGLKVGAAGAIGAGVALFKMGKEFDDAYDKIRTNTGATGKRLEGLKDDFRGVVKSVPADFDSASTAVAGLNQRLDITGRPLQQLSKQVLELSRMTGTDLSSNIQLVTRLFGDWSISTKQQGPTLDKLWRLSQKTGVSIGDLAGNMVKFGSPLRNLGIDFDFAAAMFAKFEKEGVNISTAMPGLRMALKGFAKDGKEPGKALMETFAAIKNAPTIMKANTIAFETFGTRAGPDMAAAIREGRFELDDLMKHMKGGGETIMKASRNTRDFSEEWQLFKNRVMVGLEPAATKVFAGVSKAMAKVGKVITDPKLTGTQKWDKLMDMLSKAIEQGLKKTAEVAVKMAPKIAEGLVKGFLNAPILARLAIGAWLFTKMGGIGMLRNMGAKAGAQVATGVATGATKGGAAKKGFTQMGMASGAAYVGGTTTAVKKNSGKVGGALRTKMASFGGMMKGVGASVLGFQLMSGVMGAMTGSTGSMGFGGRIQNFYANLLPGLVPSVQQQGAEAGMAFQLAMSKAMKTQVAPAGPSGPIGGMLTIRKGVDQTISSLRHLRGEVAKNRQMEPIDKAKFLSAIDANIAGVSRMVQSFKNMRSGAVSTLGDIRSTVSQNMSFIAQNIGTRTQLGRTRMIQNFQAAAAGVRKGMDKGVISTKRGKALINRYLSQAGRLSGGAKAIGKWAQQVKRSMTQAGGFSKRGVRGMLRSLSQFPPGARRQAFRAGRLMIRQLERDGKVAKGTTARWVSAVVKRYPKLGQAAKKESGKAGGFFTKILGKAWGVVSKGASKGVSGVLKFLGKMAGGAKQDSKKSSSAVGSFASAFGRMVGKISGQSGRGRSSVSRLAGAVRQLRSKTITITVRRRGTVPRVQQGTITSGAEIAMIGEAGREYVIPVTGKNAARGRLLLQHAAADLGMTAMQHGGVVGSASAGGPPKFGPAQHPYPYYLNKERFRNIFPEAVDRRLVLPSAANQSEAGDAVRADQEKRLLSHFAEAVARTRPKVGELNEGVDVWGLADNTIKTTYSVPKSFVDDIKAARNLTEMYGTWFRFWRWWTENFNKPRTKWQRRYIDAHPNAKKVMFQNMSDTAENWSQWRETLQEVVNTATGVGGDDPEAPDLSEFYAQQITSLKSQLAVSGAQAPIISKFLGSFADGGVVPGPLGKAGVAVVHGGETITPPGAAPHVEVNVYPHPDGTAFVETIVDGRLAGHARRAGAARQTPSRPGRRASLGASRRRRNVLGRR